MADSFFSARKEWSQWKHQLLRRYIGEFAGRLGSKHPLLYYVDAFAGAGRYPRPDAPGSFDDGSPVLAALFADRVRADAESSYELRCINVERRPSSFVKLVGATAAIGAPLVDNRKGTFRENLDAILAQTASCPALFFIDPYGTAGMEWDVVSRVLRRSWVTPTDLLLNLSVPVIDKHAGCLQSEARHAPKFVNRLDAFFGTEDWRKLVLDGSLDQPARMNGYADIYQDRVLAEIAKGGRTAFTYRYPVETIDGQLKYYILHASRNIAGSVAMSRVVFRVAGQLGLARAQRERELAEARKQAQVQASLLDLFDPPAAFPDDDEVEAAATSRGLREGILRTAIPGRQVTIRELEISLLKDWFGRAVEKHYRSAAKDLVLEKKMVIVSGAGPRLGIKPDTVLEFT